jgi:hypothetical protein
VDWALLIADKVQESPDRVRVAASGWGREMGLVKAVELRTGAARGLAVDAVRDLVVAEECAKTRLAGWNSFCPAPKHFWRQ